MSRTVILCGGPKKTARTSGNPFNRQHGEPQHMVCRGSSLRSSRQGTSLRFTPPFHFTSVPFQLALFWKRRSLQTCFNLSRAPCQSLLSHQSPLETNHQLREIRCLLWQTVDPCLSQSIPLPAVQTGRSEPVRHIRSNPTAQRFPYRSFTIGRVRFRFALQFMERCETNGEIPRNTDL